MRTFAIRRLFPILLFVAAPLLIFFVVGINDTCLAAPYGLDKEGGTVHDRLYESDVVVYGRIVQKIRSKTKGDLTEIEVLDGIKNSKWTQGDFLYVNEIIPQPNKTAGVIYLFFSSKGSFDFYEVNVFYPDKKKEIFSYTKKINEFMTRKDDEGRIRWLYSRVDSPNSFVAWDSFAQLAAAPYPALKKAAPAIQKESLRYLIADPKVQDNRKSFFAFLLGMAGSSDDIQLVVRIIENPANKNARVVRGAMMAYGLLLNNYPSYFTRKMSAGPTDNIRIAVLEATKNLILYEKPRNMKELMKPVTWALKNGSRDVTLHAIAVSQELGLTDPVSLMRNLYFKRFSGDTKAKIAIVTYLKIVRKKTPAAPKLLNDIRAKETNPLVRDRL